jgi:hypothetical protein
VTARPASRPAANTLQRRIGPSLSFISTQKAAKPSAAEITCEKNSAEKVITIVARPRVIAAAVP